MVCIFSHWMEAFPCRQATASSVAEVLLEKITPTWGTVLEFHSDQGTHFSHQVLGQVCATVLGLAGCNNSIIKTQLAKFVETLQLPYPKALPMVLLNLNFIPFGTRELSPFAIVTRHPMYLVTAYFDPQQIKGNIL